MSLKSSQQRCRDDSERKIVQRQAAAKPGAYIRSSIAIYPNVTTSRSTVVVMAVPSVVCNVGAPYSQCWIFRNIFAPRCSIAIWVSCKENSVQISATVMLLWGMKNRNFPPICHFISYTSGHSYSRRRIGTCMRSIERCPFNFKFEWPRITPNADFKGMQLVFFLNLIDDLNCDLLLSFFLIVREVSSGHFYDRCVLLFQSDCMINPSS